MYLSDMDLVPKYSKTLMLFLKRMKQQPLLVKAEAVKQHLSPFYRIYIQ